MSNHPLKLFKDCDFDYHYLYVVP